MNHHTAEGSYEKGAAVWSPPFSAGFIIVSGHDIWQASSYVTASSRIPQYST